MGNKFDKILTKDFLKQEYNNNLKTSTQIASEVGCHFITVLNYMKKFNISRRTEQESQLNLNNNNGKYQNFDWLYKKYIIERKNTTEIAKICNAGRTTIKRWLRKHNIRARTNSEAHFGLVRSEESRKRQSKSLEGKNNHFFGRKHSEKSKKKMSKSKLGSKPYWYRHKYISRSGKQYKFHSSWELKFAEYLDRDGIKWESGVDKFYYIDDENIRRCYWPDFYLGDSDLYIEIKGYFRKKDKRKMEIIQNFYSDRKFLILRKNDLESMGVL